MDKNNGNTKWQEAMAKEMAGLYQHGVFDYKGSHFKPPTDYQYAPLCMIFNVKADLRRKARLVIGGHVIDASHLNSYSSVVKGISIRLLALIAKANTLKCLCGDVGNAYVNAPTREKIYTRAGPEFGDREGQIVTLVKALYGLQTSGAEWQAYFSDSLRALEFKPTRYDTNV
ncbi:MAG: reverse transcriptase domain-containing protein, partial [Gaiellaceae bacterium]